MRRPRGAPALAAAALLILMLPLARACAAGTGADKEIRRVATAPTHAACGLAGGELSLAERFGRYQIALGIGA